MVKQPVRTMADLKGLKLRAPTRQTNKFLAALGAHASRNAGAPSRRSARQA